MRFLNSDYELLNLTRGRSRTRSHSQECTCSLKWRLETGEIYKIKMRYSLLGSHLFVLLVVVGLCSTIRAQNSEQSCPTDFTGPECAVCISDQACSLLTNKEDASCDRSFVYSNTTAVKTMVCNPTSPDLVTGLLVPNSFLIQCHTGLELSDRKSKVVAAPSLGSAQGPSSEIGDQGTAQVVPPESEGQGAPGIRQFDESQRAPAPVAELNGGAVGAKRLLLQTSDSSSNVGNSGTATEEPYCRIGFTVIDPNVMVSCRADECSMQPGSADVVCANISCACEDGVSCGGGTLTSALVNGVNGQAVVTCDEATGECDIKLGGLPISTITATCTVGDCIVPMDSNNSSFAGSNSEFLMR